MNVQGINELYEFGKGMKTVILLGEYHSSLNDCKKDGIYSDDFLKMLFRNNPKEKFTLIIEEDPHRNRGKFSKKGYSALDRITNTFRKSSKNVDVIRADYRRGFSKKVFRCATYWDVISEKNNLITDEDIQNLREYYPNTPSKSDFKGIWKIFNQFFEDTILNLLKNLGGIIIVVTGSCHTRNIAKELELDGWKKGYKSVSNTNCIKLNIHE